jgi:NADH-quinone oxidoreductase subunit J
MNTQWFTEHWILLLALLLSAVGVWWLMPVSKLRSRPVGVCLALVGCGLLAAQLHDGSGSWLDSIVFWFLATAAIGGGVLMITDRNPVYSALWFAIVTLSVCGLFVQQSAPFLAAATVIVYAGAIVVTFVFVIMLAQQSGATVYDQRSRHPLVGTLAAFFLLTALLFTIQKGGAQQTPMPTATAAPAAATANVLSRPSDGQSLLSMNALGRSLFGDYLFAVEMAGTLLLVATIGAIIIAPRRSQGKL